MPSEGFEPRIIKPTNIEGGVEFVPLGQDSLIRRNVPPGVSKELIAWALANPSIIESRITPFGQGQSGKAYLIEGGRDRATRPLPMVAKIGFVTVDDFLVNAGLREALDQVPGGARVPTCYNPYSTATAPDYYGYSLVSGGRTPTNVVVMSLASGCHDRRDWLRAIKRDEVVREALVRHTSYSELLGFPNNHHQNVLYDSRTGRSTILDVETWRAKHNPNQRHKLQRDL